MTNFELSIRVFLQLALILATCRAVGMLAKRLGQPQVVSEMVAGVLLGPSLFGLLFPEAHEAVFPKQTMPVLYCLAQIGLALYMFLVGAEFRTDLLLQRGRSAISVSLAGIIVPFALGSGIALFSRGDSALFAASVSPTEAMLYMGAAMSITAFPMLARIIYERRMTGTKLGTLALAAGSIDDALAWCILAAVLASFKGDGLIALMAIGGGVLYGVVVLALLRPLLRRWLAPLAAQPGGISGGALVTILVMLMLGAWYTDFVGVYAVFGAFILGLAMPRGRLTIQLQQRLEPATTNFLLPCFFVYSGLNTKITLVNTPALWMLALGILAAACIGKGVACTLAARLNREPWRESLAIGSLMNARGLMELIILNIGLEHGVITPTLFSIMVIMAVATTLMATPLFEWVYGRVRDAELARSVPEPIGSEAAPANHTDRRSNSGG